MSVDAGSLTWSIEVNSKNAIKSVNAFNKEVDKTSKLTKNINNYTKNIFKGMMGAFAAQKIGKYLGENLLKDASPYLTQFGNEVSRSLSTVGKELTPGIKSLIDSLRPLLPILSQTLGSVASSISSIMQAISPIIEIITPLISFLAKGISGASNFIGNIFGSFNSNKENKTYTSNLGSTPLPSTRISSSKYNPNTVSTEELSKMALLIGTTSGTALAAEGSRLLLANRLKNPYTKLVEKTIKTYGLESEQFSKVVFELTQKAIDTVRSGKSFLKSETELMQLLNAAPKYPASALNLASMSKEGFNLLNGINKYVLTPLRKISSYTGLFSVAEAASYTTSSQPKYVTDPNNYITLDRGEAEKEINDITQKKISIARLYNTSLTDFLDSAISELINRNLETSIQGISIPMFNIGNYKKELNELIDDFKTENDKMLDNIFSDFGNNFFGSMKELDNSEFVKTLQLLASGNFTDIDYDIVEKIAKEFGVATKDLYSSFQKAQDLNKQYGLADSLFGDYENIEKIYSKITDTATNEQNKLDELYKSGIISFETYTQKSEKIADDYKQTLTNTSAIITKYIQENLEALGLSAEEANLLITKINNEFNTTTSDIETSAEKWNKLMESLRDSAEELGESKLTDYLYDISEAFGEMIDSGDWENYWNKVFSIPQNAIADLLKELGKLLIVRGVEALFTGNIPGGLAMIGIGTLCAVGGGWLGAANKAIEASGAKEIDPSEYEERKRWIEQNVNDSYSYDQYMRALENQWKDIQAGNATWSDFLRPTNPNDIVYGRENQVLMINNSTPDIYLNRTKVSSVLQQGDKYDRQYGVIGA